MKVNNWITGIFLHEYKTDKPNGTVMGFDADNGDMVAFKGSLIPMWMYCKMRHIEDEDVFDLAFDKLDMANPNPDRLHEIAERMDLEFDEESGKYFNPDYKEPKHL